MSKYIDRIVPITRNDFGSWRGYASFRMKEKLIKRIELLYDEEIARNKINKFIMNSTWVQDMLYRPPTDTKPAGRMYGSVQSHFNQMVSENTPKQSLTEI